MADVIELDKLGKILEQTDVETSTRASQESVDYLRAKLIDYNVNGSKIAALEKSFQNEQAWATVLDVEGSGVLFSALLKMRDSGSSGTMGFARCRITIDGGVTVLSTEDLEASNREITGLYSPQSIINGSFNTGWNSVNGVGNLSLPEIVSNDAALKKGLGTKTGHVFVNNPVIFDKSLKVELSGDTNGWSGSYFLNASVCYKLLG